MVRRLSVGARGRPPGYREGEGSVSGRRPAHREHGEVPGQLWIDFIRDTAPVFRKPTLEQLGEFIAPTWQALIDGSKYVDDRLRQVFAELAPGRVGGGNRV